MPEAPGTPMLPELARSLRSLGTQLDASSEAAHAAIFLPLLEARTRASGAPIDAVLAALRGDALSARIEANAVDAVMQGVEDPANARALTARAGEAMQPLRNALLELDAAAPAAREGDAGWAAWVEQLRRAFMAADVACQALTTLLAGRAALPTKPRWFERAPR